MNNPIRDYSYYSSIWAAENYPKWQTINLLIRLNECRAIERALDRHVRRSVTPNPDEVDIIEEILKERGVKHLPVIRARPPSW